ncbi:unnamed protein product [Adineta steineri]|uniref:PLAT domain-containing protein n=1 Tax=Adineta steineri TaxID=433720 RepID=A0A815HWU2_9BILA|nr:unnamed protein product [Adineta steineri]
MYSSSLTSNSSIYFQDCSGLGPYYEAIQMNVTVTGYYTFLINSEMNATYGYIYTNNFNVFNWLENVLIHDGDYENRGQFQLKAFLQANMKYIFVMTTSSPSLRGNFSIQASGPSYIGFNRILNTPSVVQTIYISELTTNSSTYLLSCSSSSSYYKAIQVNVRRSGFYTFFSNSNMDTYGVIYKDYFDPSDPMKNRLLENDHGCGQDQFRFTIALETNVTYILVATTFNSNITGAFSIFVSGTFFSNSNMDTYGVIYKDYFDPSDPMKNRLLENDHGCGQDQFRFTIALETNVTYILVATTFNSNITGAFSIFVSGPNNVDLRNINISSTSATTVFGNMYIFNVFTLTENYRTCMNKSLTYNEIENHFNSLSNLYFLFGINIHRPFINEYDQIHADASLFIIVICKTNSSDCISKGGSLPIKYKLEFIIDGVPYTNKYSKIDHQWHRTKIVNYDFLYEPINSHLWYDQPENKKGSIWKNFIMNMDLSQNESIYSKWVEFDIKINDAGIQFIEGQQIYNNITVQQFTLHFFVPTFQCLQPPLIYFDDFLTTKTYLSAFHLQLMSDKCHLHKYTCHLEMIQSQIDTSGLTNKTLPSSKIINITTNYLSLFTQQISYEQIIKPTNFIDHIFEQIIIENNSLFYTTEIYRNATCTNKNSLTSREFVLCTQDNYKNESVIRRFRIDIILCKYSILNTQQCSFSLYQHVLNETLRLFIPIQGDNIAFIGFIRLLKNLPHNEWINHLNESYDKIQSYQLINFYDHMIELKTDVNSINTIIRYYQIITDQSQMCHLVCRNHCVQQSPNHTDYFISQSITELILFCVKCNFSEIYQQFNLSILHSHTILSRDIALVRFQIINIFQQISINCINDQNEIFIINANFHIINQNNTSRSFSCLINPTNIYPYHEEITLECTNFTTRADIILWAVTKHKHEEIRILLNPSYVTNEILNSNIQMKIYGIPHGEKVFLEISSSLFSINESYELTMNYLNKKLITKMNIALEWNYFSSAIRLMNEYLNIYENDFDLLDDHNNPRLELVNLNQTSYLISIINYYRLILAYIDQELLYIKAKDISQKIYSIVSINNNLISTQLFKYKIFYPESGNNYLDPYFSLLIQLSSHPKIITYQTYHLLRHTIKFISLSLPDASYSFLMKVLDLCYNLRIYINDFESMPISTITDTNSLFEFNQMISRILVMIHTQFKSNISSTTQINRTNDGLLDFIVNMSAPFVTKRWAFKSDQFLPRYNMKSRTFTTDQLNILYYPQEYIPLTHESSTDYLLGQLFSIESNNSLTLNSISHIFFSLQQVYLNTSNILQKYFSKILLIRIGKNFYSHRFSFQMNTTKLARNISLFFIDLPNSQKYLFTIDIAYNNSCLKSKRIYEKNFKYTLSFDLWQDNYYVYSIPIIPMSFVCGQVEITSKHVSIRNLKRTGQFLIIETGCYSFDMNIYENYYSKLQIDKCQLINDNELHLGDNLLLGAHLTCRCQSVINKYFVLCQPKPILVEYELNAQTWLHFYIYISALLLIFLFFGLYAIYKDTSDDYKPLVYFVNDNHIGAVNSHLYQLTIFTGLQQSTTKDFQIYIRLIGETCHDISHCLNLNIPNVFQRGSVDQFLLTSFIDIGRIVAINIWHNEINFQSDFYIRHCILYDYNHYHTYYFSCYTWLSLRKGLNRINEIFYVAQEVDQYAFGHLFLSTYSWLYYHYYLLNSVFKKQKINTLSRIYRLHIYFSLVIIQLYLIQLIIISCRKLISNQRCIYIFPSFLFLVDQSFVASGWTEIYQIIRLNFLPSIFIALFLSCITAFLTPIFIWCLTWLTNRLELYRQLLNSRLHYQHFDNLHSTLYTLASTIADLNLYRQDIEQFEFIHKFDLQHRLSISTIGENEQNISQSDTKIEQYKSLLNLSQNSQIWKNRAFKKPIVQAPIYSKHPESNEIVNDDNDDHSLSTDHSSQTSIQEKDIIIPTINLKINWPNAPDQPSLNMFRFYSCIYYGLFIIPGAISIVCIYLTMKTFIEIENYFLTSTILFIHIITILFTLIFELIFILLISLLNATFLHMTDEEKFISTTVQIPVSSTNDIQQNQLNHTFTLHRDLTLTDVQLRERIRERFLESSIIRAVRDVIGYILFMIIIIMVFSETSRDLETHLTMRQYTLQLLVREDIFQNIDHIPETMDWINYFIENRLFLQHKDYSCQKDTCNYFPIPDSPLYLSKSIRIRQIRVERKDCHKKINDLFNPLLPPTCSVDGNDLMDNKLSVLNGQRKCSGWNNEFCQDICNYTSIWSALASKRIIKFYTTYESPWYFMLHLSAKETVERCNRKRKYYDLNKYNWLDEKTLVLIIEGNLYSPQTTSMISFILTMEKNQYGIIEKHIFIEVSDYTLTTIDNEIEVQNITQEIPNINNNNNNNNNETPFVITHYLFTVLLFFIFTTKLFGIAKFTRNFGLYGFVSFLRTLPNIIDVLQLNNLIQSLNIHNLFLSFRVLIINKTILNHLIGLICLFAIFKFLYLLKFNPKTYLLAETMYKSSQGFLIILFFAFMNYFIFTIIGRLLFSNEENFRTFFVAFRVVLISSIKDAASTDNFIPITITRALWQFFLWLFSAKIIEYFLISFVIQKFSNIRKNHQLTDEERIVGRIFQTFWTYFAFNKK